MRLTAFLILSCFLAVTGGCGYTSVSLLPSELNSIHVDNFTNKIDPARQVSDKRASYSYWPGLETDITNAVINQFVLDKNLDVKSESKAALLLKGSLTDFRQYPLSYSGENVEEFRVEVFVDMELYNNLQGSSCGRKPISWESPLIPSPDLTPRPSPRRCTRRSRTLRRGSWNGPLMCGDPP